MAIPYYRFFQGDYSRDTRHLSLMQHGVYRLLIDLYMDTKCALKNDIPYLHRWLHCESVEEKNALEFVLTEFFLLQENRWHHKRCDMELDWQAKKSLDARDSADRRWAKLRDAQCERIPNAMQRQYERYANQNQNQNQNQNHITTTPKTLLRIDDARFSAFWSAYPRKKSKGTAAKAWKKINPDNELFSKIMASLECAKRSSDWKKENGTFIPYPATWLNAQGWEDSHAIEQTRKLLI